MEKSKKYIHVKFSTEKLREAIQKWGEKLPTKGTKQVSSRIINTGSESWTHDNDGEFFADFQKDYKYASYSIYFLSDKSSINYSFTIRAYPYFETLIEITAPTRGEIEDIFYVFDKDWQQFKIDQSIAEDNLVIFIGHGRNSAWRDLKDHLTDKHGYKIEAYETGARGGHTIRDILDDMLNKSSMALLVLTGEDETASGHMNARQNVIHETGLFQGKLGFSRAIVLLEEGTSEFTNLHGIQQIRFSKNNIKESFGEVLATIKREFNR